MMVDLKVMAYFKISLSTRNWDSAKRNRSGETTINVLMLSRGPKV